MPLCLLRSGMEAPSDLEDWREKWRVGEKVTNKMQNKHQNVVEQEGALEPLNVLSLLGLFYECLHAFACTDAHKTP